jgi:excisionase family DNA binding protein
MLAARPRGSDGDGAHWPGDPRDESADWLTMQQAACELNVSLSTVRRRIRSGELRNRMVPHRGGFAYVVYVPGSRHAMGLACTHGAHVRPEGSRNGHRPAAPPTAPDPYVRELEEQVERLSQALARALRVKQRVLPEGMGEPGLNPSDPYARYRWLVRRRRWWPF